MPAATFMLRCSVLFKQLTWMAVLEVPAEHQRLISVDMVGLQPRWPREQEMECIMFRGWTYFKPMPWLSAAALMGHSVIHSSTTSYLEGLTTRRLTNRHGHRASVLTWDDTASLRKNNLHAWGVLTRLTNFTPKQAKDNLIIDFVENMGQAKIDLFSYLTLWPNTIHVLKSMSTESCKNWV